MNEALFDHVAAHYDSWFKQQLRPFLSRRKEKEILGLWWQSG